MNSLETVETTASQPETSTLARGFNLAAVNLATRALAPNSRAAYRQALERLAASTGGQPVTDESLAAHVQGLHNQGMAPASISIVPAAVRYYARAHGAADPAGPMTKATMRIIRREGRGRGRGQAGGIIWEQADAAAAVAGNGGEDLAGLRDAAILAIMSDCLLRVSEVVGLDVSDLATGSDGSGTVTLRASKTDQEGEGVTLYVGPATVQRVQAWTGRAGVEDGPLFRRIRRGGHVQSGNRQDQGAGRGHRGERVGSLAARRGGAIPRTGRGGCRGNADRGPVGLARYAGAVCKAGNGSARRSCPPPLWEVKPAKIILPGPVCGVLGKHP